MWTSIKKIIPGKIKALGLEKEMELLKLQSGWDNLIGDFLGDKFKKKSKIIKLKNKVLFVDCLNSVWANEFQMKEVRLMKGIHGNFRASDIERIRFIN